MTRRYTHVPRTILWLMPGTADLAPAETGSELSPEIEPFYLSKWPITNEQIEAFDPGHQRSELSPGDRDTALGVDFERAREYCRWYAEVSRKPMRLPTEVEWEHACRGGETTRYFWGDDPAPGDDYLYDADNWDGRLGAADRKKANGFGLYGMLGGVWEWTAEGVLRGGSFRTPRAEISCNCRRGPGLGSVERGSFEDVGFRVARSLRS